METSEKTTRRLFPALRWVLLAGAAGALAGAAAVYVGAPVSGNNAAPDTAPPPPLAASSDPAADKVCAAKIDKAKAVGTKARGQVAAMGPADPPVSLASLAFKEPGGTATTLSAKSGKTLLLNLWATWCAPCRAEMPALDRLQQAKGSDRFEVVAVNVDTGDDAKPAKFLDEIGVHALARYRDPSLKIFKDLQERGLLLGLPATFLIDGEGCMLTLMNGPAEWSSKDATALIDTALAP